MFPAAPLPSPPPSFKNTQPSHHPYYLLKTMRVSRVLLHRATSLCNRALSSSTPPAPPPTLAPVITPILPNADIDSRRLLALCTWLQQRSVGLAVFNTNSEGNSFSLRQKSAALKHLVSSGIRPSNMMPGIGSCSVDESVQLACAALDNGISNMLMLPPWYLFILL